MLNSVPRISPAAALVGALLGWTCVCETAIAKPRDFGTTSRPTVDRSASPASVSSVQATIENAPVCVAPYDQFSQFMVGDPSGSSLNVWTDYRSGNLDIYAQKLNTSGGSTWANNGAPVCKNLSHQTAPKAVPDGSGGMIVVWEDARPGEKDIYAQRLDAYGSPMWAANGIAVCSATGDQLAPVMVADGFGGAIIAWVDDRAGGSDVYAQRLNGAGVPQWTANGVAMCVAAGIQRDLSITTDQNHGAYVAWQDQRAAAVGDIYAERINASGVPQGTPDGTALCAASGAQESPVLVADGAGGLIAGWTDRRAGNADLYVQRMNGVVQWAPNGTPLCVTLGDQTALRMCFDAVGGAIAVWQDGRGGTATDLYAQRVSAAGAPQWALNGVAICTAAGDQLMPEIQRDPAGGALVTWSDARSGTSGQDVFAQRIDGAGVAQWTADGVQLCDAPNAQDSPLTVPDGVGGGFFVWRDARGSYSDLFGQQVDATGLVANQCAPLDTLRESIPQTLTAAQNYRVFYNQYQTFPVYFWCGIAVRGAPGSDWDIEAYDSESWGLNSYPSCFGNSLAGANAASGVDFVVFDMNDNHTPPGIYGIRPYRYSGTGGGTVEFDGGKSTLLVSTTGAPQPVSSPGDWTGVIDFYDVGLTGGFTYTFDFDRNPDNANLRLYFFSSYGSPDYYYVVPGSQRVWDTQSRYYQFTAPTTAFYGVAVVNETGDPAQYVLNVYSDTPVGVGDAPVAATGIQGVTPNPTQGRAHIRFSLEEAGKVSFDVLDMAGRVVHRIPTRDWAAGTWSLEWDGRGENAARLSPGMYFVQMQVNGRRMGLGRVALVR